MTRTITDRWPTALAVVATAGGITAMILADREADWFGPSVAVMAAIYLLAYAIGRPGSAWLAFVVLSAVMTVLQILADRGNTDPALGMAVVLVVLWLAVVARRRYTDRPLFTLETAGAVVFGLVTLLCAAVQPRLGIALAGLGFLAHGLWDAYHFRINRVVSRSWAEFCAVIDIPTGVALIVVAIL